MKIEITITENNNKLASSIHEIPYIEQIKPIDHGVADEIISFMHHGVQYCKAKECYWTKTDNIVKNISRTTYYEHRKESDYVAS